MFCNAIRVPGGLVGSAVFFFPTLPKGPELFIDFRSTHIHQLQETSKTEPHHLLEKTTTLSTCPSTDWMRTVERDRARKRERDKGRKKQKKESKECWVCLKRVPGSSIAKQITRHTSSPRKHQAFVIEFCWDVHCRRVGWVPPQASTEAAAHLSLLDSRWLAGWMNGVLREEIQLFDKRAPRTSSQVGWMSRWMDGWTAPAVNYCDSDPVATKQERLGIKSPAP